MGDKIQIQLNLQTIFTALLSNWVDKTFLKPLYLPIYKQII